MRKNRWFTGLLAGAVFALTPTVWADDRGSASFRSTGSPSANDYAVVFDDDPLQGDFQSAAGPLIYVTHHAPKQLLIRPRTAFVPELLKTVETL
ncbi:MAG: hypothetical protein FWD17_09750 [Polyangiaceae bacterium]|nr:hypothetical protein [Polyangiaceae bacterium]